MAVTKALLALRLSSHSNRARAKSGSACWSYASPNCPPVRGPDSASTRLASWLGVCACWRVCFMIGTACGRRDRTAGSGARNSTLDLSSELVCPAEIARAQRRVRTRRHPAAHADRGTAPPLPRWPSASDRAVQPMVSVVCLPSAETPPPGISLRRMLNPVLLTLCSRTPRVSGPVQVCTVTRTITPEPAGNGVGKSTCLKGAHSRGKSLSRHLRELRPDSPTTSRLQAQ